MEGTAKMKTMCKRMVSLAAVLLLLVTGLRAQEKTVELGFGMEKDLYGVPVGGDDMVAAATEVKAGILFGNRVDLSLGFETLSLTNLSEKRFETLHGMLMGVGYRFGKNESFQIEPNLSVANSFRNFASFRNIKVDLGVNFHVFKVFFVGTGLRYAHCLDLELFAPPPVYTWYWKMGFRLSLALTR